MAMLAQRTVLSGARSPASTQRIRIRSTVATCASMRVFVVRHEKRARSDPTFLSPLLPEGVADAETVLAQRIGEINPTHIYASPFLRVLQTVQPYVAQARGKGKAPLKPLHVNVEYSLYESPNPDGMGFVGEVHEDWMEHFFIQREYVSFLDPDKLQGDWGFGDSLPERTARFLAHLRDIHGSSEDRILLASHQYTIHSLLSLTTGRDIDTMNFPQGEVAELEWWAADLPELSEGALRANP
mmetsp:Transcript_215/g.701  ORF Transcript_215/g.701 Transcript_215/m.701 type:complete len:241 (-) Transcript_215:48-770(-)